MLQVWGQIHPWTQVCCSTNRDTECSGCNVDTPVGRWRGMLSNEPLNTLEGQPSSIEVDCFISLNAISGTTGNKVIHLRALVKNHVLSILVDSESFYSFLNAAMLFRIQYTTTPAKCMIVRVANGQHILSHLEVKNLEWWIQGHTFQINARILDLAAYDLILGMDWLDQHNPMTCD
jgi:hypothetical protein